MLILVSGNKEIQSHAPLSNLILSPIPSIFPKIQFKNSMNATLSQKQNTKQYDYQELMKLIVFFFQ